MLSRQLIGQFRSLPQISEFLEQKEGKGSAFHPLIQKRGGRSFTLNQAPFKFKDLVRRTLELATTSSKAEREKLGQIIMGLKTLDALGNAALKKRSFICRFFTALKQLFGNINFSRQTSYKRLEALKLSPNKKTSQERKPALDPLKKGPNPLLLIESPPPSPLISKEMWIITTYSKRLPTPDPLEEMKSGTPSSDENPKTNLLESEKPSTPTLPDPIVKELDVKESGSEKENIAEDQGKKDQEKPIVKKDPSVKKDPRQANRPSMKGKIPVKTPTNKTPTKTPVKSTAKAPPAKKSSPSTPKPTVKTATKSSTRVKAETKNFKPSEETQAKIKEIFKEPKPTQVLLNNIYAGLKGEDEKLLTTFNKNLTNLSARIKQISENKIKPTFKLSTNQELNREFIRDLFKEQEDPSFLKYELEDKAAIIKGFGTKEEFANERRYVELKRKKVEK